MRLDGIDGSCINCPYIAKCGHLSRYESLRPYKVLWGHLMSYEALYMVFLKQTAGPFVQSFRPARRDFCAAIAVASGLKLWQKCGQILLHSRVNCSTSFRLLGVAMSTLTTCLVVASWPRSFGRFCRCPFRRLRCWNRFRRRCRQRVACLLVLALWVTSFNRASLVGDGRCGAGTWVTSTLRCSRRLACDIAMQKTLTWS